jgi:hypothetical protein
MWAYGIHEMNGYQRLVAWNVETVSGSTEFERPARQVTGNQCPTMRAISI